MSFGCEFLLYGRGSPIKSVKNGERVSPLSTQFTSVMCFCSSKKNTNAQCLKFRYFPWSCHFDLHFQRSAWKLHSGTCFNIYIYVKHLAGNDPPCHDFSKHLPVLSLSSSNQQSLSFNANCWQNSKLPTNNCLNGDKHEQFIWLLICVQLKARWWYR